MVAYEPLAAPVQTKQNQLRLHEPVDNQPRRYRYPPSMPPNAPSSLVRLIPHQPPCPPPFHPSPPFSPTPPPPVPTPSPLTALTPPLQISNSTPLSPTPAPSTHGANTTRIQRRKRRGAQSAPPVPALAPSDPAGPPGVKCR